MSKVTLKVLFLIRTDRINTEGKAPVYLRVTVNGERKVISLDMRVDYKKWDAKNERLNSNRKEDQEINLRIDSIRLKIIQIYRDFENGDEDFTSDDIIYKFLGKDRVTKTLLEAFQEHNDKMKYLVGKECIAKTLTRYQTTYKYLSNFISKHYKKNDIPLSKVDYEFITEFEFFLKIKKNLGNNTATKYMKNLKKIIRIALANDWIKKDPFYNIKLSYRQPDRPFLTLDELDLIRNKEITIPRLSKIKDIFVFCCFTGLAFSDIQTLKIEHLIKDNNGKLRIRKKRVKTQEISNIPILQPVNELIAKYKNDECRIRKNLILPVPTNQKMNAYLKEIADICGINKELTSHVARHTFATSVTLGNKVSLENVSKMLGHADIRTTRIYAHILDQSIMKNMEKVESLFTS